jgi:hypothetical protein
VIDEMLAKYIAFITSDLIHCMSDYFIDCWISREIQNYSKRLSRFRQAKKY